MHSLNKLLQLNCENSIICSQNIANFSEFFQDVSAIAYKYMYEKHFPKMYRDVGMAVPTTTETRCRDGSVQARHSQVIKRLHKQPNPYIFYMLEVLLQV